LVNGGGTERPTVFANSGGSGLVLKRQEKKAREVVGKAISQSLECAREKLGLAEASPLKLVVGVSGGQDSHVLLHALVHEAAKGNLDLVVSHVNHGLRPESDSEESFVVALAERYKVPVSVHRAPVREARENVESWARRLRYQFLISDLQAHSAHFIATAHHQEDQAETLLFRLLSGRLASISHVIAKLNMENRLLRPMLAVAKHWIGEYGANCGLDFVSDASNQDVSRTRNAIRHELMPLLRARYNPHIASALELTAARLNEDEEYMWREAYRVFKQQGAQEILRKLFLFPPALRWRFVSLMATEQVGIGARKLGYRALSSVLGLLSQNRGKPRGLELGHGISCRVTAVGELDFVLGADEALAKVGRGSNETSPLHLSIPGQGVWKCAYGALFCVEAKVIDASPETVESFVSRAKTLAEEPLSLGYAYFDLEELPAGCELTVRSRRDGDVVVAWRRGRRKLKKLLQEHRVAAAARDSTPIIECEKRILWVPGISRSNIAPITPDTKLVLELSCRKIV
jgi:tRNA(Ile)-lysidine synthase